MRGAMPIIRRRGLGFDLYTFESAEKDGESFYVMKLVSGGIYMNRQELQEVLTELQRELEFVTDEDIVHLNKCSFLESSPEQFVEMYGEDDPLWHTFISKHPDFSLPKQKRVRQPIIGYVYVIKGDEQYKIGCTKNVKQRLRPMGAMAPFPLQALVLISTGDMEALEAELHEKFAAKRIRGEWFNLDESDVDYIRRNYDITDPSILKVS